MIDSVIRYAENLSRKNITPEPGDYYGDGSVVLYENGAELRDGDGNILTDEGLLYCGRCNTLKQYRFYAAYLNRVVEPCVLCRCSQQFEKSEHDRIVNENRERIISENLSKADSLLLKNTFASDKRRGSGASRFALDYVRDFKNKYFKNGVGLFIYGPVGVGKTFYASCVANALAKSYGCTIRALSITKAVNDLFSASNKSAYIDSLASVDLLVLDDFGAQRRTDYALEQVFSIIDERYKAQKPLILTSNLDYDSLSRSEDIEHKRICDRIRSMCLPFEIKGSSMRRPPTV